MTLHWWMIGVAFALGWIARHRLTIHQLKIIVWETCKEVEEHRVRAIVGTPDSSPYDYDCDRVY